MSENRAQLPRLSTARRRALEAIRDGHGRCGLGNRSGFLQVPACAPADVVRGLRRDGLSERGEKVGEYAYMLVLTEAGREALGA